MTPPVPSKYRNYINFSFISTGPTPYRREIKRSNDICTYIRLIFKNQPEQVIFLCQRILLRGSNIVKNDLYLRSTITTSISNLSHTLEYRVNVKLNKLIEFTLVSGYIPLFRKIE